MNTASYQNFAEFITTAWLLFRRYWLPVTVLYFIYMHRRQTMCLNGSFGWEWPTVQYHYSRCPFSMAVCKLLCVCFCLQGYQFCSFTLSFRKLNIMTEISPESMKHLQSNGSYICSLVIGFTWRQVRSDCATTDHTDQSLWGLPRYLGPAAS